MCCDKVTADGVFATHVRGGDGLELSILWEVKTRVCVLGQDLKYVMKLFEIEACV